MYRAIYKQTDGQIAVTFPMDETVDFEGMKALAVFSTPEGVPFKIITQDDFPSSLDFQEAWEIDDAEFTDGIGWTKEEKLAYIEQKKQEALDATNS